MNSEIQSLSAKEREVLYLIYQLEPATAQAVQSNLKLEASYNSVRRILDSLVEKRFVTFKRIGRKYHYEPVRSRTEQGTKLLREIIHSFFDASPALGFASLIKGTRNQQIQDLEIDNARRLLEQFRNDDDENQGTGE